MRAFLFAEGRDGAIRALDAENGALSWEYLAGQQTFHMQRVGNTLLVETESGRLLALSTADGALQRTLDTGFRARLVPAGDGRVIVCGSPTSWVLAAEDRSGTVSNLR